VCGGGGENPGAGLYGGGGQVRGGVAVRRGSSLSGRRQGVGTEDGGGRGHDAVDGGEVALVRVGHVGGDGLLPRVLHEKLLRFLWPPTVWDSLHGLVHGLVVARRLFGSSHVLHVRMLLHSTHHFLEVRMRHG